MKYLKEYGFLLLTFIVLIGLLLVYYLKEDNEVKNLNLNIVPTYISKIENNSVWCPTFQLIWNDMKNKVIGQDIEFVEDKDNIYVKDLNKESFKETMISDEYYYKNYDYMTYEFRDRIKYDIKEKFNEESDILDNFNFQENSKDYLFYSMLVRNFTFKKPFDILTKKTFGINNNSSNELDKNVKVLFYEDYNNYAIKLLTNELDEVILYKGERKDNFKETYDLIVSKSKEEEFTNSDTLEVSNINFKNEKNYKEISNKSFYDINGVEHKIDMAVQTLMFKLDNTGGKVKSEAGIALKYTSMPNNREFIFTDDFVLFLREENKEVPYLGLNITDISKFQ